MQAPKTMTFISLFLVFVLALSLAKVTMVTYKRMRPRLTFATTVVFLAGVSFAMLLYFFTVSVFITPEAPSSHQYLLQRISWIGTYWSYILFAILGLFAFLLLIIEKLSQQNHSD
jgi:hypothetical protein